MTYQGGTFSLRHDDTWCVHKSHILDIFGLKDEPEWCSAKSIIIRKPSIVVNNTFKNILQRELSSSCASVFELGSDEIALLPRNHHRGYKWYREGSKYYQSLLEQY